MAGALSDEKYVAPIVAAVEAMVAVVGVAVAAAVDLVGAAAKEEVLGSAVSGDVGWEESWCVVTGVAVTVNMLSPSPSVPVVFGVAVA